MKKVIKYIPASIFFDWEGLIESSILVEGDKEKIYGLLEHSYNLLNQGCDDFQKVDIISNLRRIITKRIKTLFITYQLGNLEFELSETKKIEKLEKLGIVKSLLIHELLEIRNNIEYNDKKPPSLNELKKLIDTVWYFIRSTDVFVSDIPDTILFENPNKRHWLEVEYDFKETWTFKLRGWIPQNKIFTNPKNNALKIIITEIHNKKELKNPDDHKNKLLTDYYIQSIIELDGKQKIDFINVYFSKFY